MASLDAWCRPPVEWPRALLSSIFLSSLYTSVVLGAFLYWGGGTSMPLWRAVGIELLLGFGTIGIPVLLWLRYEIRSPVILMGGILLYWHVLIEFPPIGTGEGDTPGFTFVFLFAPIYVAGYGPFAGTEYWLRRWQYE